MVVDAANTVPLSAVDEMITLGRRYLVAPGFLSLTYPTIMFGSRRLRILMDATAVSVSPSATITTRDFWKLCIENVVRSDEDGHGCTPSPVPRYSWSATFAAMNEMATLREGMKSFARLSTIVPAGIDISLSDGHEGMELSFIPARQDVNLRLEHYIETVALAFHCVAIWTTGRLLVPRAVRASTALDPSNGSVLAGLVPELSRAGRGVTITYDGKDGSCPLGVRKYRAWCAHETSVFYSIVSRIDASHGKVEGSLLKDVRQLLAGGQYSQRDIARQFHCSEATLRRKLKEAGVSFRQLANQSRCHQLTNMLLTKDTLDDIAEQLGFADRRSVCRFSKQHLGMTPSAFRLARLGPHADQAVTSARSAMALR